MCLGWWSLRTALTIAASLAQIGEFSFILAGLGVALGVLPEEGRGLILAGAIISILLNPLVFEAAERLGGKAAAADKGQESSAAAVDAPSRRSGFEEVLVGYGRVGSHLGGELLKAGRRPLVIEMAMRRWPRLGATGPRSWSETQPIRRCSERSICARPGACS
jgi:CPA2 family monovalent cation:H+ antiporter-2